MEDDVIISFLPCFNLLVQLPSISNVIFFFFLFYFYFLFYKKYQMSLKCCEILKYGWINSKDDAGYEC